MRVTRLDGRHHAAQRIYLVDVLPRAGLELGGQCLEKIGTTERIHRRRHAALVRDHLLRAQGQQRRLARGQPQRLVQRVGVQGVGSPEHRGQRLHGGPHDVVVRLLGGQRHPGGLGVEAQLQRALVRGAEALAHDVRPYLAGGPILGDLLEERL